MIPPYLIFALALVFAVVTVLMETENFGWLVVVFFAALGGVVFWRSAEAMAVLQDWRRLLVLAVVYVMFGVVWSFVKWVLYLTKWKRRYQADYTAFLQTRKESNDKNECLTKEEIRSFRAYRYYDPRPTAASSRSRIIAWMTFWPCSLVGFLLTDPFKYVYDLLNGGYQRVANNILGDVEGK